MSYKDILNLTPTIQSASLVSNLTKKKKKRKLVNDSVDIIFGTSLIQAESKLINTL